jgi:hypothetical protein
MTGGFADNCERDHAVVEDTDAVSVHGGNPESMKAEARLTLQPSGSSPLAISGTTLRLRIHCSIRSIPRQGRSDERVGDIVRKKQDSRTDCNIASIDFNNFSVAEIYF